MAFVVTEPCVGCKYSDCVAVCPVDAFREGQNFLVIDPKECIDCGACVPACPTEAIYLSDDVPSEWTEYIALNAELSRSWPTIVNQKKPLPGADGLKGQKNKRGLLSKEPA